MYTYICDKYIFEGLISTKYYFDLSKIRYFKTY